MKNILLIAGTRPNFVKLAPLYHRFKSETGFKISVCHTGQHYDKNMSDSFFECLELPVPDFSLNVKGGNVPETIGKTILAINEVLQQHHFDLVIVFGDVNATVAGAITAVQSGIKLMHVEAGLRSFDRRMPEEINRILTDSVSDYLMVSEESGLKNLKREGFSDDKVFYVGNIMIESLIRTRSRWEKIGFDNVIESVRKNEFALVTFHRPENVDNGQKLKRIVSLLKETARHFPVIFPIHPRTSAKLKEMDLFKELEDNDSLILTDPLGYFEFLNLVSKAKFVMTDSGGIQEETSFLNVPCVTFRNNTERPVTIDEGTNILMDVLTDFSIDSLLKDMEELRKKNETTIKYWDENVSQRIMEVVVKAIGA